jgi:hypothetical protein
MGRLVKKMKIAAEWSAIPPVRRHGYFYTALLLGSLAANVLLQTEDRIDLASSHPEIRKLDRIRELEHAPVTQPGSQPILTADLSLLSR